MRIDAKWKVRPRSREALGSVNSAVSMKLRDSSHLTTTTWNFTSSGIGAAPIPDDKKMGCMVTNVAVRT